MRFNSIKVRLKHNAQQGRFADTLFQFHKGPIKASGREYERVVRYGFNSIKVRLKPLSKAYLLKRIWFQFHKGPIKAKKLQKRMTKKLVSIP